MTWPLMIEIVCTGCVMFRQPKWWPNHMMWRLCTTVLKWTVVSSYYGGTAFHSHHQIKWLVINCYVTVNLINFHATVILRPRYRAYVMADFHRVLCKSKTPVSCFCGGRVPFKVLKIGQFSRKILFGLTWCVGIHRRNYVGHVMLVIRSILLTVQITFVFIGQTHLVFGKRVCTCVTKHSNAFRTFLNWLKNTGCDNY